VQVGSDPDRILLTNRVADHVFVRVG